MHPEQATRQQCVACLPYPRATVLWSPGRQVGVVGRPIVARSHPPGSRVEWIDESVESVALVLSVRPRLRRPYRASQVVVVCPVGLSSWLVVRVERVRLHERGLWLSWIVEGEVQGEGSVWDFPADGGRLAQ